MSALQNTARSSRQGGAGGGAGGRPPGGGDQTRPGQPAAGAGGGAQPARVMSGRVISIGCSTSPSAVVVPTVTAGRTSPQKAVYAAMTANPGGIQSSVQLGLDNAATPVQMYFTSFVISTAVVV